MNTNTQLFNNNKSFLNNDKLFTFRLRVQQLAWSIAIALLLLIVYENIAPFGLSENYVSYKNKEISPLGPKGRVLSSQAENIQIDNLIDNTVYFTTDMLFQFDKANVRVAFQNPYPDQEISLGFQDQSYWHYNSKIIDSPIINSLAWEKIGTDPALYQREKTYNTVEEFLSSPPKDKIIGVYNYMLEKNAFPSTDISDYQPSNLQTVIDTPLRGKHTLYTYLQDEPFTMIITKQDLNWYDGDDVLIATIYKDGEIVYSSSIEDDGITDSSRKTLPEQSVIMKNPGPELPETGVYKIVLDAPYDVIVKNIKTNLHKIVFEGPLYPMNNSQVYPEVIATTSATTLYTDALEVRATLDHSNINSNIFIEDETLTILELHEQYATIPKNDFNTIIIPESDMLIDGLLGYFSFSPEQFFEPVIYKTLPVKEEQDVALVDYILTSYKTPYKEGDWQIAEVTFDLSNAYFNNGKLSWIISLPNLKENERQIPIKQIEIQFQKKSLFE
jgi:hypothetical protein